ncbi:unannotated protein [freshwater metagenome]|uniref:Unannotated protein n=1 Tax=freshwater metagenome TaxID=449393 RepID=A0A6J7JVG5_9ZZZZ
MMRPVTRVTVPAASGRDIQATVMGIQYWLGSLDTSPRLVAIAMATASRMPCRSIRSSRRRCGRSRRRSGTGCSPPDSTTERFRSMTGTTMATNCTRPPRPMSSAVFSASTGFSGMPQNTVKITSVRSPAIPAPGPATPTKPHTSATTAATATPSRA